MLSIPRPNNRSRRSGTARWLGALALLVCAVVVGAAGVGAVTIGDVRTPTERWPREGTGELADSARACQTFVARYDGLSQVDVLLDDLGHRSDSTFTFTLRAAGDGSGISDPSPVVVSLTHSALDVNKDAYHTFEFPPVEGSAGKAYAFCLEAPETPLDEAITAIGMLDDWYSEGEAKFHDMWGKVAGVQDLDFSLGYRLSLAATLRVLSERLVANKPFLCGARWFYALLGLFYLALLYVLLARFVPSPGDTSARHQNP